MAVRDDPGAVHHIPKGDIVIYAVWAFVALTVVSVLMKVALTGTPKDPATHSTTEAVIAIITGAFQIWLVWALWGMTS